jgi:hypothetical protein
MTDSIAGSVPEGRDVVGKRCCGVERVFCEGDAETRDGETWRSENIRLYWLWAKAEECFLNLKDKRIGINTLCNKFVTNKNVS